MHPNLELRAISDVNNRGIVTHGQIERGETLIRIPSRLVLSGSQLPTQYAVGNEQRAVSSWLRCLAAYYKAEQDPFWNEYIASLPSTYETLWQWTDDERNQFLAGTSIPLEELDDKLLQQRYQTQIRPYLQFVGVFDSAVDVSSDEYCRFSTACQAIRTRCFHLEAAEMMGSVATHGEVSSNDQSADNLEYDGPYFLPVMDLLNHASAPFIHTVIRQAENKSLLMIAERHIDAGMEVWHSYSHGMGLTAAEFLLTFGFVANDRIQHASSLGIHNQPSIPVSSCLIKIQTIVEACWHVIDSGIATSLMESVKQLHADDETWLLEIDTTRVRETLNGADDHIAVQYDPDNPDTLWSNQLVTIVCLQFLPTDAYDEAKDSLLDKSILEDYFLGKLACTAMLHAINVRKHAYRPIQYKDRERDDDAQLLKELEACRQDGKADARLASGLTVRIEEKASLDALRRRVIHALAKFDDDDDDDGDVSSTSSASDNPRIDSKRRKS